MSQSSIFWNADEHGIIADGGQHIPSQSLGARFSSLNLSEQVRASMASAQRGETFTGTVDDVLSHFGVALAEFERGITSATSNLPIRENLEAEVSVLTPLETPLRNILPRVPGAGTAAAWRQATSLGSASTQIFFGEAGAPGEDTTAYAGKSSPYKLMGVMGSVTGLAMAAGANFMNQLATEKTNQINNLLLKEENALINASATTVTAPWGDGTTAFGYNGIKNLITTANGTPSGQVQTSVGALTTDHIDGQLRLLQEQGARGQYMLLSGQEIQSLVFLAKLNNTMIQVIASPNGQGVIGYHVTGYVHPLTGEIVPIYYSRHVTAGEMYFLSKQIPDGKPVLEVEVLPQVQLPELAPNTNIQGYVAQEIAPSASSPQKYPFIISLFSVLKLRSALHVAKSTGVTAAVAPA